MTRVHAPRQVFVSTDNGGQYSASPVYWRQEMFGAYDRSALYGAPAADFAFDAWTVHAFDAVQRGVTNVRLHFGQADQTGDSRFSLDSVRVDRGNTYKLGLTEGVEPPPDVIDATCQPTAPAGPLDFEVLRGTQFSCLGDVQHWRNTDATATEVRHCRRHRRSNCTRPSLVGRFRPCLAWVSGDGRV